MDKRKMAAALLVMLAWPAWTMAALLDDPGLSHGTFTSQGQEIAFHRYGGNLANTCNYDWWYGCSPTSAGMMMGHYDRNGYSGAPYSNLVPGGVAEANSYGGGGLDSDGDPTPDLHCNKVIASAGHIADFWTGYGNSGDDPLGSGRAIPGGFNSLADFMGTSQDSCSNTDGSTTFFYYTNGAPFTEANAVYHGVQNRSGMYGIGEYLEYAGYDADILYNQYIDALGLTYGFTLAQYKAEIDAGRPVLIHIENHTMFGYGYVDGTNTINVYDTWNPNGQNPGFMTWGGTYAGAPHMGVTVLVPIPEPGTLGLLGIAFLAVLRRRRAA